MCVFSEKEVEKLCREEQLIQPYDPKKIKHASYDLSVGGEYRLSHEKKVKKIGKNWVVEIPPYTVCFVLAWRIKLPKNVCAFVFSRHRAAKERFLMYPQPPLDPGYEGSLYTLLHNLSNETVRLQRRDHLATIVFLKLSSPLEEGYRSNEEDKYMGMKALEDIVSNRIYTPALKEIYERVLSWKESFLSKWISITLVIITVILMILTILRGLKIK